MLHSRREIGKALLRYTIASGVSEVELRGQPAERFAGARALKEILQTVKKNRWAMPATIEPGVFGPRDLGRREGSGEMPPVLQERVGIGGQNLFLRFS
jgi:hypothetical protein